MHPTRESSSVHRDRLLAAGVALAAAMAVAIDRVASVTQLGDHQPGLRHLDVALAAGVAAVAWLVATRRRRPRSGAVAAVLAGAVVVLAGHRWATDVVVRQHVERLVDTSAGLRYRGPTLPLVLWIGCLLAAATVLVATCAVPVVVRLVGGDRPTPVLESRFARAMAALVAGGYLVRVVALLTVAPERTDGGDPLYYHAQANLLASGRGFIEPLNWIAHADTLPSALHGPGYSLYLSLFSRLGATTYFDHKMASIVAGAAVVLVAGLIGARVAGRRAGIVAAALAAVYPNLWVIDGVLFPEGLFVLLCGVAILFAYRWRDSGRPLDAAVLGAAIGAAALTRGEGIFLVPLLVVPWVWWTRGSSRRARATALAWAAAGVLVTVGPWTVRNLLTFEEPVPLSTNGNELHVYSNCPDAYSGKFLGYWVFACQERLRQELGEPAGDESQKSVFWRSQGVQYARDHLGEVPKVVLARVGRQWEVFRPLQNVEFANIESRPRGPTELGLAMYYVLAGLSVAGAWVSWRRRQAIWPVGVQFLSVTVTAAYAYGTIRFRAPAELALCVLGAVAVDRATASPSPVLERARRTTPRQRTWIGAGLLAAGLLLPLRGLLFNQGPPMEEGFMLVFPERVLAGDLPNRDFLHLYGPGGLWVLAGVYQVFGVTLTVQRLFGFLQLCGIVFGVYGLTRRHGTVVGIGGALASLLVVVPSTGLTALAWLGGVALAAWAVVAALRSAGLDDERRARRWAFAAGIVGGVALLYRLDLVVAVSVSLAAAIRGGGRQRWRALLAGAAVGSSPYLVHLATAGVGNVIQGMVLDPVVYLRGGRTLPLPPPTEEFAGWLNRLGELWVLDWPLPALRPPVQVTAWFFLLVAAEVLLAATAVGTFRRARGDLGARALCASSLLAVGLLPQAIQRADTAHLAWVSCVAFGIVPAAIAWWLAERSPRTDRLRGQALGAAAMLGSLLVAVPAFTYRNYTDLTVQTFGRHRLAFPIDHQGRRFYYGRPDVAGLMPELLADVDRLTEPGDRLLVGTGDLRRTPYSEAFLYYLLPDLVPATYYIEMDPGVADAEDSRLADDVASADLVILSTLFDNWDEPNDSRQLGSDEPNRVLDRLFCLHQDYDGFYRLYVRCS